MRWDLIQSKIALMLLDFVLIFNYFVVWVLIVAGAVEAVWGLLQIYGYLPSNHSLYALTGSFYNPGPYSGFLAMCLPVALHESLRGERFVKPLARVALVLMLLVLPSGMSRTAWLAASVSSVYVVAMFYRRKLRPFARKHWKALVAGGLLLVLLGAGTYHWKKDSADGRRLMWKIALAEIPATVGVGWDQVAGVYGEAQERYFALGKGTEQEKHVADAPEYVFNEYLQIGLAWGFPMMVMYILILLSGFYGLCCNWSWGPSGALLSFAIFSFASYPFQFVEFQTALFLLVSCGWICWIMDSLCLDRKAEGIAAIVMLLMLWGGSYGIGKAVYDRKQADKQLERASMLYRMGAYEEAVSAYESHRKDMAGNARKLFEYGHTLHRLDRHAASSEVLKKALKVSSDPMVLNIIGKNCQAMGEYKEAEYWFIRSTNRVPNRIYPYYLLAKLYAECPDVFAKEKLEWAVRMVLEKDAKVESTAIREMREEVKELVDENQ